METGRRTPAATPAPTLLARRRAKKTATTPNAPLSPSLYGERVRVRGSADAAPTCGTPAPPLIPCRDFSPYRDGEKDAGRNVGAHPARKAQARKTAATPHAPLSPPPPFSVGGGGRGGGQPGR